MVAVTYTFAAGGTIQASELNQNFDDIEAALTNLDTTNLSSDAGIKSTQIADRYCVSRESFWLVPPLSLIAGPLLSLEAESSTVIGPEMSLGGAGGSFYTVLSHLVTADSGQEVYLCEVLIRHAHSEALTGQFQVTLNGTVVGGNPVTLDANQAYYRIRNTNPIDDPIASCSDGDELKFQLKSVLATTGIRGLFITLTWKYRLTN